MAEEGIKIEGEAEESSQAPVQVEQRAREKGWKPREESDLPEDQWIDAREFLGRQPLYDQIHALKRTITKQGEKFQNEMSQISDHFAKMQKVEYEKALKQLKAEKRIALEERDIAAVETINDEIKEVEEEFKAKQAETPKVTKADTSIEFNEWRATNQWFDQDKELQREAISIGTGYAINNPNLQQSDVLEYVEKRIRKIYPEKFEKKETKKMTDNSVESGVGSPRPSTRSKGLTKNDLSSEELQVMNTLVKRGVFKDKAAANKISQEEQYLRDLSEAKGLK